MLQVWKRKPTRRYILCWLRQKIIEVKALTRISIIGSQRMLRANAILLRNTTWKCGRMERLVVSYLRRRLQHCGYTQSSIKDMLAYFKLKGRQKTGFLEAIERLERRRIIKTVTIHFSSPPELNALSKQGGL